MGHCVDRSNNDQSRSIFRRIAKDPTANTLAISAASLVPLMAMVGGGVDASRYYMAETRLQAACDAGALAARRAMDDDDFTTEHKQIGLNFFDQNYDDGMFGTENLQRDFTATNDGEVTGTATGNIPTSIMGAFGYNEFDLDVTCEADINISNTDITFVVDVTGSMGCTPDGTSCPGGGSSTSRMQGLRDAVMTFYDTVEDSTSNSAQVRYGMVPYSTNVNVGNILVDANPAWMANSHTYQSREASFVYGDWEPTGTSYERTGDGYNYSYDSTQNHVTSQPNFSACVDYYYSLQYSDDFVSSNDATWTQVSATSSSPRTVVYTGIATFAVYEGAGGYYSSSSNTCNFDIDETHYEAQTTITVTEEREEVFTWLYKPVTFDLSTLYDDNRMTLPLGANGSDTTIEWDGCIEEADTVADAVWNPIPAGANDLDINLIPDAADEYWKPVLNDVVWKREDASGNTLDELEQDTDEKRPGYVCPAEAFRLTDISRSDLLTYVNGLNASGNTYHDFGMIWGARFTSPNGIFSSANSSAPNGDAIGRHIVFMTDGQLQPWNEGYTMYGVEWWDRRISGDASSTTTANNHAARFQAACRLARQENISVWVVAFGTALTQNLIDCATPGRAFAASNSAELDTRFKEIAQQIAALRLTQ